jgi:haloalkane dehalogenase
VRDIPLSPSHRSWATLAAVEQGLAQFKDHPTAILWGLKDFCFNQSFLDRWTAIYPDAEKAAFNQAGHYLLEDSPEAVSAIAGFLTRA